MVQIDEKADGTFTLENVERGTLLMLRHLTKVHDPSLDGRALVKIIDDALAASAQGAEESA